MMTRVSRTSGALLLAAVSAAVVAAAPSAGAAPPAGVVTTIKAIGLKPSDLRSGETLRLMRDGAGLDQVTLTSLCGYHFTSEHYRVARREWSITLPGGTYSAGANEVVAYSSPAKAALAIRQWWVSQRDCPGPHAQPVSSRFVVNRRDVATLPVHDNELTHRVVVQKGHKDLHILSVLQVKGRFLDAMWLATDRSGAATRFAELESYARITGARLERDA